MRTPGTAFATDPGTLARVFRSTDEGLLPLWVAEPDLPLAEPIVTAVRERAATGWYGYEARPQALHDAFTRWAARRHDWDGIEDLHRQVSPSVATSIGVLLEHRCRPGDGVVLQPPVFSDFKPLVRAGGLRVETAPLVLDGDRYVINLEALERVAALADVRVLAEAADRLRRAVAV